MPASPPAPASCPACHAPMPAAPLGDHCPRCLLHLSVATLGPELLALDGGPARFGDYELLEEIARGGTGVVYRARQRSLDRIVAVKVLVAGEFAGAETRLRFRAEAEAAARLQHPGIVAIHDIGESEGLPWLSMDYLPGGTLAGLVREAPLPARVAATHARIIAEAVQHAHAHGVLHRDLKPSNILLDAAGQPRVTDFGIARRFDAALSLTRTGQVLGSPGYMAPEQAFGDEARIGPATDVYGLGALLYHLLTGRPPFQAPTLDALLLQLRDGEPLAPRRLDPAVPRDLETICLHCLRRAPSQRYASAEEVAADLTRFLDGRAIRARPVSPFEKVWHWCLRQPAAAALLATVAAFVIHIVISRGQALDGERQRAEIAERFAREQRRTALVASAQLRLGSHDAGRRGEILKLLREAWALGPSVEIRSAAIAALALADATEMAPPPDTPFDPPPAVPGNPVPLPSPATASAWHANARRLAIAGADKMIYLIDPDRRVIVRRLRGIQGACRALAFSPDGLWLASAFDDDTVRLWDVRSGEELLVVTRRHGSADPQLQWSRDGEWLGVSATRTFRILRSEVARCFAVEAPESRAEETCTIDLSPDGRWLATVTEAGTRLWNVDTQREAALFSKDGPEWSAARFSADSARLWIGGWNSGLRAVDLPETKDEPKPPLRWVAKLAGSLFEQSGDGEWLVALSNDGGGFQCVAATAPDRDAWLQHRHPLWLALTPDSRLAATSSYDAPDVQLWDFRSQRRLRTLPVPAASQLALTPDGKTLITGTAETLAGWDVETGARTWEATLGSRIRSVACSPDGRFLAVETRTGIALSTADGAHRELASLSNVPDRGTASFCFSRDSRQVAIQTDTGGAILWQLDTLARELTALGMPW